jgi:hypothetical protein
MAEPENVTEQSMRRASAADRWVDELVPEELDWQGMVRSYPLTSVGVAAIGGFLVGRYHGARIVQALSELASQRVDETVDRYLEFGRGRSGSV